MVWSNDQKFFPSLSFSHSASDDDDQSGIRKFRQNCLFLLLCTVFSIIKIQIVFKRLCLMMYYFACEKLKYKTKS